MIAVIDVEAIAKRIVDEVANKAVTTYTQEAHPGQKVFVGVGFFTDQARKIVTEILREELLK